MAYTEYEAVTADNATDLVAKVAAFIADGWQPYGNPVAITEGFQVLQVVVKGSGTGGGSSSIASDDITDASTVGKAVLVSANEGAARTAIGAGTSSFSGSYNDLTNKPAIPAAAAVGTEVLLQTGTDTVTRTWTAKMISEEIARQIAAIR
ncbi:hypothetical protein D3C84_699500 [compost metagenome]